METAGGKASPRAKAGAPPAVFKPQKNRKTFMTLIERQQPSHWYLRDGQPYHEVAKKDGSGMRSVTLADARKVWAFPSVTNVLGIIAKPGLEAWKIEQGILAALTLPRRDGEDLGLFAKRVVADMSNEVEKAADFGTAIHNACELYAREKVVPSSEALQPYMKDWMRWFDENVERVDCLEKVFVARDLGFAGRVDMVAKLRDTGWAVVDFKTQKIKRSAKGEPKPAFYETWPLQLAAYHYAATLDATKPISALVSVVIDSAVPGPVHVKDWGEGGTWFDGYNLKVGEYLRRFTAALELWKYVKEYDPVAFRPENN